MLILQFCVFLHNEKRFLDLEHNYKIHYEFNE